ncbi:MAG: hypothetical protein Q4D07_07130 [Selenomonadaceae bacterium]|nr:hypothetical protein [Selenomonadaceae bacterium]
MKYLSRIFLLLTAFLILSAEPALAHNLPDSEMRMEPFSYGVPISKITALFGDAYRREEIPFGEAALLVWRHYEGFSVQYFSSGSVKAEEDAGLRTVRITSGNLATRSGFITMPCGIAVGDDYKKVIERFGVGQRVRDPGMDDVYCYESSEYPGRVMSFSVNKQGKITAISLESEL